MKSCIYCNQQKALEDMVKHRGYKGGYASWCKACHSERNKKYYQDNRLREDSKKKEWIENNREKVRQYNKNYKARYTEQFRDGVRKWKQENPWAKTVWNHKRRTTKLNAWAKWDSELTELVTQEAAHLAKLRELKTGIKWHVDHVIPLIGKNVCGLHVWNNLAVIPAHVNVRKSNKLLSNTADLLHGL